MSTRWIALAAAFLAPSFTAPSLMVLAQEPPELFGRLDTNKDGYVAADEVPEAQKGLFERLVRRADDDGDKKLSKEEFQKGFRPDGGDRRPQGAGDRRPEGAGERRPGGPGPFGRPGGPPPDKNFFEAMFDRTDSNSDGKLTKDEVPEERQGMRMIFERVGGDSLDKEQFVRGMLAMAQNFNQDRRPGEGPPDRPRDGRPGDGRPGDGPPRRPEGAPGFRAGGPLGGGLFMVLDTNRDGELSNTEIVGAGSALLKLDRNSDGKITPDEVMGPPGGRPGEGRPRDGERRPGDRGPGDRGPREGGPRDGDRGPREGGPRDGDRPREDRPRDN